MPSKASLVARGLASKSKPPVFKRPPKVQKEQQKVAVKESKPGYSLHSSDSEDQAFAVGRGLNRCAALLSNILDNEDKGTIQSRAVSVGKPVKSSIKKAQPSLAIVRSGKNGSKGTSATSRHVVIPTAKHDEKVDVSSPSSSKSQEESNQASTAYNDRLVSSTPVLTAEERQKRQQLQRREAQLQQEIMQLKERYELLQRQQSPSHQAEQKLQLQNSMMQELENHQKESRLQQHSEPKHSAEIQSGISFGSEKLGNSNSQRSSARRSLDYSGFHVEKSAGSDNSLREGLTESQSGIASNLLKEGPKTGVAKQVVEDSESSEPKKRVRIVSPVITTSAYLVTKPPPSCSLRENLSNCENGNVRSSDGSRSTQGTPSTPSPSRHSSFSVRSRDGMAPSSADNHCRMIQYLVDELRALLGSTGDLEVNRLLTEIDEAAKLLPFLVEKDKTTTASQDIEQAIQPYKIENAQLRRRLLIAHQKLNEGSIKKQDEKSSVKTDLAFELAACRSVNCVLQKQLTEEKNNKAEILRDRDQLSRNLSELQEEKKKFMQILSNKGQDYLRLKREWEQDTSKLTAGNKKLQADLEALQLSTEAEKKEINILNLSLRQKDAEIGRLKELTRGLQQSLTRLLSDIQQFQPNDLAKTGLPLKSVAFDGLTELIVGGARAIGQTTASRLSLEDKSFAARGNCEATTPNTSSTIGNPPTVGRSEECFMRETPDHRSFSQRKHLRFADGPHSRPKPMFSSTSELSPPVVRTRSEDSACETVDVLEGSTSGDSMGSPGVLQVKDLEDEQINGDVSPLSSGEEEDFKRGLENLDANIARIQKSLRETALRT